MKQIASLIVDIISDAISGFTYVYFNDNSLDYLLK